MHVKPVLVNDDVSQSRRSGRQRACALGALVLAVLGITTASAMQPSSAAAFGTIRFLGQSAEHERLTRAALACPAGTSAGPGLCFEPATIAQLAGRDFTIGAIGQPDVPPEGPASHCDDADFLNIPGYPRTRVEANAALTDCIFHLGNEFSESVDRANGIVSPGTNAIDPNQVRLTPDCEFSGNGGPRAKCNVLFFFGRSLHGVQDFYAHSNWTDEAGPGPINRDNPPGLNRSDLPTFFNFRGGFVLPSIPLNLSTGCFNIEELSGGSIFSCIGRVRHLVLNKDKGQINPVTGAAFAPTTSRGQVRSNFANAVTTAIADTRRLWVNLRGQILTTYGAVRGGRMVCAVTHDDPIRDC